MSQKHPSRYIKLTDLSLLIMRYLQRIEDEYNPELVAFMMDHSYLVTHRWKSYFEVCEIAAYGDESMQSLLLASRFPDYAECELLQLSQWCLLRYIHSLRMQHFAVCHTPKGCAAS